MYLKYLVLIPFVTSLLTLLFCPPSSSSSLLTVILDNAVALVGLVAPHLKLVIKKNKKYYGCYKFLMERHLLGGKEEGQKPRRRTFGAFPENVFLTDSH